MIDAMHNRSLWISLFSLAITGIPAVALPLLFPEPGLGSAQVAASGLTILVLGVLVWATQRWRVALRGARGDVSISMAIDVAMMLLLHPLVAAASSALGTALYHQITVKKEYKTERAVVRGVITFAAVSLGSWLFHMLRPGTGPLVFVNDWLAVGFAIALRLGIRVIFYPLGMAVLREEPVMDQLHHELDRLPLIPFLLTTTLGALIALIWQSQPAATILLVGPLVSTWSASQEMGRLNELLATLEDKVEDRTARLGETVRALERRLAESEAMDAVSLAMAEAIHPDEVLEVIARESGMVTGGTSALVLLLTEDREQQVVRAAYGKAMKPFQGLPLPVATSLAGLVLQTGEVHISKDPANDPRLNQDLVRAGNWRSLIEAPLLAKDQTLGVLVSATTQPDGFDEQDLR
ncbi:MAG TPA: GAF domain-containing protein, partial [Symbiobacteriaceae bacterium]|nr:GAF domain-containing protein [Symbiobacteriaceae bacterium]